MYGNSLRHSSLSGLTGHDNIAAAIASGYFISMNGCARLLVAILAVSMSSCGESSEPGEPAPAQIASTPDQFYLAGPTLKSEEAKAAAGDKAAIERVILHYSLGDQDQMGPRNPAALRRWERVGADTGDEVMTYNYLVSLEASQLDCKDVSKRFKRLGADRVRLLRMSQRPVIECMGS